MIGVALIISACFLWALDTLIRYPLINGGTSAQTIVFTEHMLLTFFFIPTLWKMRKRIKGMKALDLCQFIFIGGIGSALATVCFTRAFALINPSLVILLQKLQPLFAILLAALILKEPLKKEFILWSIVCLFGGLLISYEDISTGLHGFEWSLELLDQKFVLGHTLALIAVIGWGTSTVFGKSLTLKNFKESELMAGRFFFGLLFLLPFIGGEHSPIPESSNVFGKIALMVAYSGLLGMFLYYQGLKRLSARSCALAEMFFPFCAIGVNWVFLNATLTFLQLLGAAFLLLGSTVIQLKRY